MAGSLLTRLKHKICDHPEVFPLHDRVLRVLRDGLARLGINILPYYLVLEGLERSSPPPGEMWNEYTFGFLEPHDMQAVAVISSSFPEEDLVQQLQEGRKCFGAKHRGEIVAVTWCSFDACFYKSYRLFPLKENEAYLFNAYTGGSFRGKGLAPYLRYRCYEELARLGKDRVYSITFYFNAPALRFKRKLNAQVIALWAFFELSGRWRLPARLRTYTQHR